MTRKIEAVKAPYDLLYSSSAEHILWGNEPGRLLPLVKNFTSGKTVFDVGCGDGKNALFLERNGFAVTGVDCSRFALRGLRNRFQHAGTKPRGNYGFWNILEAPAVTDYEVLISYGLFHCLPSTSRHHVHNVLQKRVRLGGIAVFTCLTNRIPLPEGHGTIGVRLAAIDEVSSLFSDWTIEYWEEGVIWESHPPIIGIHHHSAVWLIARRINR